MTSNLSTHGTCTKQVHFWVYNTWPIKIHYEHWCKAANACNGSQKETPRRYLWWAWLKSIAQQSLSTHQHTKWLTQTPLYFKVVHTIPAKIQVIIFFTLHSCLIRVCINAKFRMDSPLKSTKTEGSLWHVCNDRGYRRATVNPFQKVPKSGCFERVSDIINTWYWSPVRRGDYLFNMAKQRPQA